MSHLNWDKTELKSIMGDMLFPDDKTSNATSTIFILGHILTMRAELKGLCILIKGEKLLLRGTLAPKNGRNRYGLGTPVPNTWRKQFIKKHVIHLGIKKVCLNIFIIIELSSPSPSHS